MNYMFGSLKRFDYFLYGLSVIIILISNTIIQTQNLSYTFTVLIGLIALIYTAKAHVLGQIFMVIFSILYSLIALNFDYYSEFITYGFMTLPMSVVALVSWMKHPSETHPNQVKTAQLKRIDWLFLVLITFVVTLIFGFVLYLLKTPNLMFSILSITTSFVAVYLTYRRSQYYAIAYATNDLVLVALWGYATFVKISYLPLLICFSLFFIYDLYGFIHWSSLSKLDEANRFEIN